MQLIFYYASGGIHPQLQRPVFYASAAVLPNQEGGDRYDLYACSVLIAIAQTPASCDRLMKAIASVEAGADTSIVEGGNDVLLNIDASGIQVDILANDEWVGQPDSRFTLQEWRKILDKWKYLLGLPKDSEDVILLTLP
ncbi:hypothetical protein ACOI9X_05390 [Pseudomonas sp. P2757]|uniref:hypothetical protein n=1 Tax=unclassified Pseudomonas TaxID=196821 RepID=UPI003B590D0F